MLCGMCFQSVQKVCAEDPSAKCTNCMLYFHRKCTFLNRVKKVDSLDSWLCNHCRRNRVNKNSNNLNTLYFFKVESTDINNGVKAFQNRNSNTWRERQVFLRTTLTNKYCNVVRDIIKDFPKLQRHPQAPFLTMVRV